jgi:flagellin
MRSSRRVPTHVLDPGIQGGIMGLRIYNNVEAANAHRVLNNTNDALSKSMERLSSGLRINRAADDAAGLAVSEVMRSQIRGMNVASRNAQDGVSLVQVADGALGNVGNMLQRVRDLAVQAANGTLTDSQRSNLNAEVQQILTEINATGAQTEFNGIRILAGSVAAAASAVTLQVGANGGQAIAFTIGTVGTTALTIQGLSVSFATAASAAIASLDVAIGAITTQRANLGAIQNRLEQTINRLGVTSENLQAAESRIRDADMAAEMISFTKNQILQQSGMAMLSQANAAPQSVLSLLR